MIFKQNPILKKQIINSKKIIKKTRKIISIIAIMLLLSTILSSVVSSRGFIFNSLNDKADIKDDTISEKSLKEIFNQIMEKLRNLRNQIKERISKIKYQLSTVINENQVEKEDTIKKPIRFLSKNPLIATIRDYIAFRTSKSSFMLYTNYNGIEKQTQLYLFSKIYVDVNNDTKEDISVKLFIYPLIEKPLALSLNFKLEIIVLEDFPDIRESFKVYTELYFPGIILSQQAGDRVRFGYESPKGEEVPDKCYVNYKYIPNLIYLTKNPEHKAEIDPGNIKGTSNLALYYSYTNFELDNVSSELISRIMYKPAVITRVSYGGNAIIGGSLIEFNRELSDESDVDVYCSFEKNNSIIRGYALNVPKNITFIIDFGRKGFIEYNSYGDYPSEIGICDDLENPVSKVYFTGFPAYAKIEWDRAILFDSSVNISVYTDGVGIGLNGDIKTVNSTLNFSIISNTLLDFSIELNLKERYFELKRSQIDLNVTLDTYSANNSTMHLSFNIKQLYDSPIRIYFNKLFDGEAEVMFSTKSLEINNLTANLYLENMGNLSLQLNKFKKTYEGYLRTAFSAYIYDKTIIFSCTVNITNGIELRGLKIGYEDFTYTLPDINNENGDLNLLYSFEIQVAEIDIWISEDRSQGYISISGGLNVIINSNYYNASDELICILSGAIGFNTDRGIFNISWKTIDGNITFKVNGTTVLSLNDFNLWVKDKINVKIPLLLGSFRINTEDKEGEIKLYLNEGMLGFGLDTNINITDLFNFTLKSDIRLALTSGFSVYLAIAWNESGLKNIEAFGEGELIGEIDIRNIIFKYENKTKEINILTEQIKIGGDLTFSFDLSNKGLDFRAKYATLLISNLHIYIIEGINRIKFQPPTGDLGGFTPDSDILNRANFTFILESLDLSAEGSITFTNEEGENKNINDNDREIIIDGSGAINIVGFHLIMPEIDLNLEMTFSTDLHFASEIKFDIVANKSFEISLESGILTIDNFYLNLNYNALVTSWSQIQILSSLGLYIKKDNVTKEIDIGVGGNGRFTVSNLFISTNSEIARIEMGLIDVILDHIASSIINLKLNISDLKNLTFVSAGIEGSITKLTLSDVFIDLMNIPDLLKITDFSIEFTGTGEFSVVVDDDGNLTANGYISGPSAIFADYLYVDALGLLQIELDDFNINGPTTFSLVAQLEFEDDTFSGFGLVFSIDTNWDMKLFNFQVFDISILKLITFNGHGIISLGVQNNNEKPLDFILGLNGYWNWNKLIIGPFPDWILPNIIFEGGSFNGNIALSLDLTAFLNIPDSLALGHIGIEILSPTTVEFHKIESNFGSISILSMDMKPGDFYLFWNLTANSITVPILGIESTSDITISGFDIESYIFNRALTLREFVLHPGTSYVYFKRYSPGHGFFMINNSGTFLPTFGRFVWENTETGKNVTLKSITAFCHLIKVEWEIDALGGDPDFEGYLAIDTDNETTGIKLILLDVLNITGTFKTDDWNLTWNISGLNPFKWLKEEGYRNFIDVAISIKLNGIWRYLIGGEGNSKEPQVYINIWLENEFLGSFGPNSNANEILFAGLLGETYTFRAYSYGTTIEEGVDTIDPEGELINAYQWQIENIPFVQYPWDTVALGEEIIIQPITCSWNNPGYYVVTLRVKNDVSYLGECSITMNIAGHILIN